MMSEDNLRKSWLARLGGVFLHSPLNTILALALLYFAAKVYLFDGGMADKGLMFLVAGVWLFLLIVRYMFVLLLVLLLFGGGYFWYYSYWSGQQSTCEENGGYWNSNTKTCEEKTGFWTDVQKLWRKYKPELPHL